MGSSPTRGNFLKRICNIDLPSLPEIKDSASDVDIKELAQTPKIDPKYERKNQRIKNLRQEVISWYLSIEWYCVFCEKEIKST